MIGICYRILTNRNETIAETHRPDKQNYSWNKTLHQKHNLQPLNGTRRWLEFNTSGLSSAPSVWSNEKIEISKLSRSTTLNIEAWSLALYGFNVSSSLFSLSAFSEIKERPKHTACYSNLSHLDCYLQQLCILKLNIYIPIPSVLKRMCPLAIKSVVVHKRPIAVKLMFNSVCWAL